jgi:aryl-alcohol dehydrogenase-like predicted oxidoreductase
VQHVKRWFSMKYRMLGNSGLKVSELCLGTMTFGSRHRNIASVTQDEANRMVKYALDHGINCFDTADVYSKGDAEIMLGNALKVNKVDREKVIIASKTRVQMSEEVNDVGLSRHHIMNSIEKSLKRLQVDYIDLYQVHNWDPLTPIKETMRALNDLVAWGKVRYIGASNYAAWQIAKANFTAMKHGWPQFITFQGYWSLMGRGIEFEVIPLCKDQGIGLMPWSPLAGGLLSGKYRRDNPAPKGTRLEGEPGLIPRDDEKLYEILDVMDSIAKAHKVPVAAVALAWLKYKETVSTIIIGARTMQQLEENIKAGELELTPDEVKRLDDVSEIPLPYPQWMLRWTQRDRRL